MLTNTNTICLITLASVALYLFNKKSNLVKENFGTLPPQVVRAEQVVAPKGLTYSQDMYQIPPTYKPVLNPRQAGMVDYGAFIRYKAPEQGLRADSMGSIKEGYCGSKEGYCGASHLKEGYSKETLSNILPLGETTQVNALGEVQEPIVFNRYIYANQKSRNANEADFIRGDLPIMPMSKGWFAPSANPQTALREGAMMILGGEDNKTTKEVQALKAAITTGMPDTSYSIQTGALSSAAGGDIQFSRFP